MSYNPETAPYTKVAELLAKIHAVPTGWYDAYHQEIVGRDKRLENVLGKEIPRYAFTAAPFISGLEAGKVHLGGGEFNSEVATKIFDMQVESGVLQKMYAEEAFHPKTAAGQRIVTTHGGESNAGEMGGGQRRRGEGWLTIWHFDLSHDSSSTTTTHRTAPPYSLFKTAQTSRQTTL